MNSCLIGSPILPPSPPIWVQAEGNLRLHMIWEVEGMALGLGSITTKIRWYSDGKYDGKMLQ